MTHEHAPVELTKAELDAVAGGKGVFLAGSNPKRQNGFFTGASPQASGGIGHAFTGVTKQHDFAAANFEMKPPSR